MVWSKRRRRMTICGVGSSSAGQKPTTWLDGPWPVGDSAPAPAASAGAARAFITAICFAWRDSF